MSAHLLFLVIEGIFLDLDAELVGRCVGLDLGSDGNLLVGLEIDSDLIIESYLDAIGVIFVVFDDSDLIILLGDLVGNGDVSFSVVLSRASR